MWLTRAIFNHLRGRTCSWLKFILFVLVAGWFVVIGFQQDHESEFGEHLDGDRPQGQLIFMKPKKKIPHKSQTSDKLTGIFGSPERVDSKQQFAMTKASTKIIIGTKKSVFTIKENVAPIIFETTNSELTTSLHPTTTTTTETVKKEVDNDVKGFLLPPNFLKTDKPGDMGKGVILPSDLPPEINALVEAGWKAHELNQYVSDLISVHRNLTDNRTPYCHKMTEAYSKNMSSASVIVSLLSNSLAYMNLCNNL